MKLPRMIRCTTDWKLALKFPGASNRRIRKAMALLNDVRQGPPRTHKTLPFSIRSQHGKTVGFDVAHIVCSPVSAQGTFNSSLRVPDAPHDEEQRPGQQQMWKVFLRSVS